MASRKEGVAEEEEEGEVEGKQKALACVPSDVAFNVCPTRARSISFSNKHDRGQEKKKEIAAALARSLARSIDRSILRFGWCAIASRLSLTASTSASTSRSLHTDRGICYLVFATTRSEALARVRFAHAPPCLPILRTESARSPLPPSFPTQDGRESGQSLLSLSLSPPLAASNSNFRNSRENVSLPSIFPILLLFSSLFTCLFFPHFRTKERTRSPPSYPPGNRRFKYRGSFCFLFFYLLFFSCKTTFFFFSLSLSGRNNRHAID